MKKGFTLVEILAVIIILGIVALIAVPITADVIASSRQKSYDEQVDRLIGLANQYSLTNSLGREDGVIGIIDYEDLIKEGLITEMPKDPRNSENLSGCITYVWRNSINQYEFNIVDNCEGIVP